jgi:hypothetical protein
MARIVEWRSSAATQPAPGAKYHVVTVINSTVGDNTTTINTFGQAVGWSAEETARLVTALRAQQPRAAMSAQELRDLLPQFRSTCSRWILPCERASCWCWAAST